MAKDSDWALFNPKTLELVHTGTFNDCQSQRRQGGQNLVIRAVTAYEELVALAKLQKAQSDAPGIMLQALREAEAFISGFEDDDVQNVTPLLKQVRDAIKAGEVA